jgi:hypothetical protein
MTSSIPTDVREDWDFAVARHIGQSSVTYPSLLAAPWPDWVAIDTIEHAVANGVLRWVGRLDAPVRTAFAQDLLTSIDTLPAWTAFKARVWEAMDASGWLPPWDCWTPQGDLWQAALIEVFHTINHHFHPTDYISR